VPQAFATPEQVEEYDKRMPEWMQKTMRGGYDIVPLNEAAIRQARESEKTGDVIFNSDGTFRYKEKKKNKN